MNCWHENDSESEAMWKLYGGDAGIAVKTSFKGLSECFKCEQTIYIGKIEYVDYNTTLIGEGNLLTALLHKRESFSHEREVRVVAPEFHEEIQFGKYFEVDISTLIEEVVVAPYSPKWLVDLIKSVAI